MGFESQLKRLVLEVLNEGPDHGYGIACRIRQRSRIIEGREAVLYACLHDLEGAGELISTVTIWNGGPRRRYQITEMGLRRLEQIAENATPTVGCGLWERLVPEGAKGA